jgi:hypothetical protein
MDDLERTKVKSSHHLHYAYDIVLSLGGLRMVKRVFTVQTAIPSF